MDVLWARAVVLAANAVMMAIRVPHGRRSRAVPVARSRSTVVERTFLAFAMLTFVATVLWACVPRWFAFADYPLRPWALVSGAVVLAVSLWFFHRSHADLGTNWSVTLEVRQGHTLVTHGVYARVRHPMYSSLLLMGVGQALALPNWLVGPSYLAAMTLIVASRLGPEERMVREEFGAAWDAYAARTKRLVPGVW